MQLTFLYLQVNFLFLDLKNKINKFYEFSFFITVFVLLHKFFKKNKQNEKAKKL